MKLNKKIFLYLLSGISLLKEINGAESVFNQINNYVENNINENYIQLLKAPEQQKKLMNYIINSNEPIFFIKSYLQFVADPIAQETLVGYFINKAIKEKNYSVAKGFLTFIQNEKTKQDFQAQFSQLIIQKKPKKIN